MTRQSEAEAEARKAVVEGFRDRATRFLAPLRDIGVRVQPEDERALAREFAMVAEAAARMALAGGKARPGHASDCATHNEPAMPARDCDCGYADRLDAAVERARADSTRPHYQCARDIARRWSPRSGGVESTVAHEEARAADLEDALSVAWSEGFAAGLVRETALTTTLEDANQVCRSAHSIAQRNGEGTNWPTWLDRLGKALTRQAEVLGHPQWGGAITGRAEGAPPLEATGDPREAVSSGGPDYLDVVFSLQGNDYGDTLHFVDVHGPDGRSLRAGTWRTDEDGHRVLRLYGVGPGARPAGGSPAPTGGGGPEPTEADMALARQYTATEEYGTVGVVGLAADFARVRAEGVREGRDWSMLVTTDEVRRQAATEAVGKYRADCLESVNAGWPGAAWAVGRVLELLDALDGCLENPLPRHYLDDARSGVHRLEQVMCGMMEQRQRRAEEGAVARDRPALGLAVNASVKLRDPDRIVFDVRGLDELEVTTLRGSDHA